MCHGWIFICLQLWYQKPCHWVFCPCQLLWLSWGWLRMYTFRYHAISLLIQKHSAIVLLLSLGLMATYTGYVIGQFKWRYPHIQSMADAGEVLMGSFGRELFGIGQFLLIIFVSVSHLLTFTVAMNSITEHGTCTIVFGVVGLVLSFFLCLPRTLSNVSWLSLVCRLLYPWDCKGDESVLIVWQLSPVSSHPS